MESMRQSGETTQARQPLAWFTVEQIRHYPFHISSELRVVAMLCGSLEIRNVSGSCFLSQGDIEFISVEEPAEIFGGEGSIAVILHIRQAYLEAIEPNVRNLFLNVSASQFFPSEERNLDVQNIENTNKLKAQFRQLFREFRAWPDSGIDEKNLQLFCRFSIEHFNDMKKHLDCLPRVSDHLVQRFLRMDNYLQGNLQKKITLNKLANREYLNPQYLSAEFRNKYNRTFGSILEYYRIVMAVRLLLTEDLKIAQVADQCGFSDNKYFYRAFKKHMGCTPSQFKLQLLRGGSAVSQHLQAGARELEPFLEEDGGITLPQEPAVLIDELVRRYTLLQTEPGLYMGPVVREPGPGPGGLQRRYCLISDAFQGVIRLERQELWVCHEEGVQKETPVFAGEPVLSLPAEEAIGPIRFPAGKSHVFFSRLAMIVPSE